MCIINYRIFIYRYQYSYIPVRRDGEIVEGFRATPIKSDLYIFKLDVSTETVVCVILFRTLDKFSPSKQKCQLLSLYTGKSAREK